MADGVTLVETNIHFLEQGIELLDRLNDRLYLNSNHTCFDSSIGKHMRHILEHYLRFLNHEGNNKIDYDARKRDQHIEQDRNHAISIAQRVIRQLEKYIINPSKVVQVVWIKNNEGNREEEPSAWCESSIQREFQFLISHTVHHYALIAIILRIQGYQPPEEFGVAPSTLRYQEKQLKRTS